MWDVSVRFHSRWFFLNAGKRAVLEDFAIPFGDDDKDASIWFLDRNYHEVM